MANERLLYLNGIDGELGGYAHPPRTGSELVPLLAGFQAPAAPRRAAFGIDPHDLEQTGWGVAWPAGQGETVRRVLAPLLERRRGQARGRYLELEVEPGESCADCLERHGVGPGPVEPEVVPYYLLIAAGPETIPFAFQSELAVAYGVGRLDLSHPAKAAEYAARLVAFEERATASPRHAAFFGVEHRDDPLTWLSSEHLTAGLEQRIARANRGWEISTYLRRAADKQSLARLLGGAPHPALLFTASHGLTYSQASPKQATHQGALLCADYPGPEAWDGPIPDHQVFAAHDLAPGTDLAGLVLCSFACFSAGTPRLDPYVDRDPEVLAERPTVAPLARALLARGALGVIGHVDLTFEQSFLWHEAGPQLSAFESLLRAILAGHRLGHAMEYLADRHAQLASRVAAEVRSAQRAETDEEVVRHLQTWAAWEDARNFVLLGDPAARLQL